MKKVLEAKSPTRIDIAGGTLDLWPIHAFFDNCLTLNFAIDVFTHAKISEKDNPSITIRIKDLGIQKEYAGLGRLLEERDTRLNLIREQVAYWSPQKGFELETWSESPVGGGLGGSSSLMITLLGLFQEFTGMPLDREEFVQVASNMEARVLGVPTGVQDYYGPLFGGMSILEFGFKGCKVSKMELPHGFDEDFLLVYTGRPHESGINNWDVLKKCVERDEKTRSSLCALRDVALEVRSALEAGSLKELNSLLRRELECRAKLSPYVTSKEIENLNDLVVSRGGALKICGAGGGGCVFVWCPENRDEMRKEILKANFRVMKVKPVGQGLQIRKTRI